jgi:hypothetical protein
VRSASKPDEVVEERLSRDELLVSDNGGRARRVYSRG